MQDAPCPIFHMPVFEGDIFEDETTETFLANLPKLAPEGEAEVFGLFAHIYLPGGNGERCIAEKALYLHCRGERWTPPTTSTPWAQICRAWCADRLIDQSVGALPLPWNTPFASKKLDQKLLTVYWSPQFSIISQEYLPTFLEGDGTDPLGEDAPYKERVAMASLILPAASSHHQRLKNRSFPGEAQTAFDAALTRMTGPIDTRIEIIPDLASLRPI